MAGRASDDRSSGVLSRDDLFLLMESYRNTIELNTTLLEQQKLIVDSNKAITASNGEICKRIEEVVKKLDTCATEISKTHAQWNESRIRFNAANSEEHLKLKSYLHIIALAMGTLCVSIIGTAIKAVTTFHSWGEQIQLLDNIAKVVGAG